jgi:heterotetrameric sarcosine oxidase gamma subunit
MTPKALATVTDSRTTARLLPPTALIAFDIWGDPPHQAWSSELEEGWRTVRVEPTVWWLTGPIGEAEAMFDRLETVLGDDGGVTDLTGGFARIAVAGPAWRELLMIGGVFDAEAPGFGAGSTAGTLLHHVAVRYDVISDDEVHILLAPSYADDLLHHLSAAISRLGVPDR